MKEAKICIIAVIVTCLIIVSTSFALPAVAEAGTPVTSESYYGKLVAVTSRRQLAISNWIVECQDKDGNIWEFLNDEGLEQGNILTLLMFRVNDREEDDECMEYMYEGHTDNLNLFFQMMGWR